MPKNKSRSRGSNSHSVLVESLESLAPHLASWLDDVDSFAELRLKARDDGTILAIAKGYNGSGGPVVCFGVAYDAPGAILAVNSTINAGNWREDKPWDGKGK